MALLHKTAATRPAAAGARSRARVPSIRASLSAVEVAALNKKEAVSRSKFLENQAMNALQTCANNFDNPVFPCALIAGDVVMLHMLHRLNLLTSGKVKVAFIDTYHLFPETYTFLKQLEEAYNFKAVTFQANGLPTKADYQKVHGSDLFLVDVDKYDYICKVEPFQRALKTLKTDVMINGRRRDHGAERAHLEVWEHKGSSINCQPLAWWEFEDCFAYLQNNNVPKHPLHDQGYPSIGDVHSTVPVDRSKWFEYGGERSGRFQGMKNPDGTAKTECGIHAPAAAEAAVKK